LWEATCENKSQIKHNEKNGKLRAYIGLLHKINDKNYLIPLSSVSPTKLEKYNSMRERVDFLKITKGNHLKSVIDIGFMIPVPQEALRRIDIDSEPPNQQYILQLEREQIRKRSNEIIANAQEVYNRVLKSKKFKDRKDPLSNRCLDFPLLEQRMEEYIAQESKR
jgi:hypothetical protein